MHHPSQAANLRYTDVHHSVVDDATAVFNQLLDESLQNGLRVAHFEQEPSCCRLRKRHQGVLTEHRYDCEDLIERMARELAIHVGAAHQHSAAAAQNDCVDFTIRYKDTDCHIEYLHYPTSDGATLVIQISHWKNIPASLEQTGLSQACIEQLRMQRSQHNEGITLVTSDSRELLCNIYYAQLEESTQLDAKILSFESTPRKQVPRINQITQSDKAANDALMYNPDVDHIFVDWRRTRNPQLLNSLLNEYPNASVFVQSQNAAQATRQLTDIAVSERQLATNLTNVVELQYANLICPHCADAHEPNNMELELLRTHGITDQYTLNCANGCSRCNDTGIAGQLTLMSSSVVNDDLRSSIEERSLTKIKSAFNYSKPTLQQQRLQLVCEGKMQINEL